ncbi:ABC transporter permease [Rhodococcus koreensis]|uniref:NitT/TauT family transport system permease protein n=1 Tax=Rhodococcus koreensis TaxID=99653 RepID=A0A1H4LMX3_9NOCA|nr:ABC transporter permease [Rhodococcus koreensis]SEB71987.1 NitT/TauT family transport system permease protein [Rhodococcus koreensis]
MNATTLSAGTEVEAGKQNTEQRFRLSQRWADNLLRILIVIGLIGVWALIAATSELVPSPGASMSAVWGLFADGSIYRNLNATMSAVGLGFVIATAVGFPTGYIIGRSKFLGDVFDPIIAGAFAIPRVIFFPILLQIFGLGLGAQSAMAALAAVFPIIVSTAAGVRAINPILLKLGRATGASPLQTMSKIVVPAMAPSLMVGIRIGFSIAFINVLIAEFFATRAGLGQMAMLAYGKLDLPTMYGVIMLLVSMALVGNIVLWAIERKITDAVN